MHFIIWENIPEVPDLRSSNDLKATAILIFCFFFVTYFMTSSPSQASTELNGNIAGK